MAGLTFRRKIGRGCQGFREFYKVWHRPIASDPRMLKKASDKFSRHCSTWRNPSRPKRILPPVLSLRVAKKLPAPTTRKTAAWDRRRNFPTPACMRSEEHTSELQSRLHLVC